MSKQHLDTLHSALVEYLLMRIESTKITVDGEVVVTPLPASELAVMAKLLKDNGIVADKDHADDLAALQAQLNGEKSAAARNSILQDTLDILSEDSGIMH